MKLWKFTLTAVVVALVAATAPLARANYIDRDPGNPNVLDGKYTFMATDGHTSLDGNWVIFQNDLIVDYYFDHPGADAADPYPPNDIPLTPLNSHHDLDVNQYYGTFGGLDTWYFRIWHDNYGPSGEGFPVNYNDQFSGGNAGATGALYSGWGDPDGVWLFSPIENGNGTGHENGVPEAGGTFALLAGALTALGAGRRFLFGRAA